jgi:hypothetical protein
MPNNSKELIDEKSKEWADIAELDGISYRFNSEDDMQYYNPTYSQWRHLENPHRRQQVFLAARSES